MIKTTERLYDIASSPWSVLAGTIASVLSFCWLVYEKLISQKPGLLSLMVFFLCIAFFLIAGIYSAVIRRKVQAFQAAMYKIHRINHGYRDVLRAMFHRHNPITDRSQLVVAEEKTLRSVCQKICSIYEGLIGRPCLATVKLITKESNGKRYCSTYIRSEENCERDNDPMQYEIGKLLNTAFDQALLPSNLGLCSHFFSADLTKERNYNNQRQHWQRYYRSTIVVPIRSVAQDSTDTADDVAFLCIDTMSQNRLNERYHLQLLAGFADQMYNFISLMRGKYKVIVEA
ncbi:MAG: hypothetical protein U9Q24_04220 [Candidatus Ratteibacteria bacterium]|nr:hypothetical protein [Candidatus Ratteibacteria bacterium]